MVEASTSTLGGVEFGGGVFKSTLGGVEFGGGVLTITLGGVEFGGGVFTSTLGGVEFGGGVLTITLGAGVDRARVGGLEFTGCLVEAAAVLGRITGVGAIPQTALAAQFALRPQQQQ